MWPLSRGSFCEYMGHSRYKWFNENRRPRTASADAWRHTQRVYVYYMYGPARGELRAHNGAVTLCRDSCVRAALEARPRPRASPMVPRALPGHHARSRPSTRRQHDLRVERLFCHPHADREFFLTFKKNDDSSQNRFRQKPPARWFSDLR